jgi:peptidoglycan/xylan/chitin deacetylase (PgdA/CDA1 family)
VSWQRPRPEPTEEEVRRRRQMAVGAIVGAFALFLLAVVLAVAGSGGDDNAVVPQPTVTAKKPPPRRRPRPLPGFPAVPASAPGAHKAPRESIPILAYDVINTPKADTTNSQDWVTPDEFRDQMGFLATNGFHPVTMRQVWAAWKEGGFLPSKPIVISFDIGYHSVYANALPVLQQRQWPGTLFLQVNQTQADFPIAEVQALAKAGWEIDSHGETGTNLTTLSDEELGTEITNSRQAIRRNFASRTDFFSYPGGQYDDHVVSAVEAAGYLGAVTLESGVAEPGEDAMTLRRIHVENGDGQQGLADKLSSVGVK